ncbi:MAG: hypothetical protein HC822_03870 [Oscillochloris sp.]|nr:hypothetical protein [Oscillochloris sp.]
MHIRPTLVTSSIAIIIGILGAYLTGRFPAEVFWFSGALAFMCGSAALGFILLTIVLRRGTLLHIESLSAQDIALQGGRFWLWFSAYHLLWATASATGIVIVIAFLGLGKEALALIGGLIVICSMTILQCLQALEFLPARKYEQLVLCWVTPLPHRILDWLDASINLRTRYSRQVQAAVEQPGSFVHIVTDLRGRVGLEGAIIPFKPNATTLRTVLSINGSSIRGLYLPHCCWPMR